MEKSQFVNEVRNALSCKEFVRFETLLNTLNSNYDYFWEKIEILLDLIEENPTVGVCLYHGESDALNVVELIWLLEGIFWWVSDEIDNTVSFHDPNYSNDSAIYTCILHKIKED